MAQRTVHYLFGELISGHVPLSDKRRFLVGSILPDAIERCHRDISHFKVTTPTHKYFDFSTFRAKYSEEILQDDLYLGYYMHLVEDAFYRVFFHSASFPMPHTRDEVHRLHQDYHILNAYIVRKYQIQNILDVTFPLGSVSLSQLTDFHIDDFLRELAQDFTEQPQGTTTFVTEQMLDQYIRRFVPLAIEEAKSVKNGSSILNLTDFVWPAKR